MALKLQFTEAGLAACLSAQARGLKVEITHMAFGSASYTPSKQQLALKDMKEKIEISDYEELDGQLRMAGAFTKNISYTIAEIGVYIGDTLLGVYSQAGKNLGYRSADIRVVQWFTIATAALPADSFTVNVGEPNLNLILDKEFIMGGVAFIKGQTAVIKQAHWSMQLSEQIRNMEGSR